MIEGLIFGMIQGIVEWLPVSSEAAIVLVQVYLADGDVAVSESIEFALFLHLGTFMAAFVYFRNDVFELIRDTFRYREASEGQRRTILFILVATLISGFFGLGLMELIEGLEAQFKMTGSTVTLGVGLLLLITGTVQVMAPDEGLKGPESLNWIDGGLLGLAQGLAALPGISRSGMTVSALLLRRYKDHQSLRLSFLLSLPIVLAGNVVLNYDAFYLTPRLGMSLVSSFVFGLLTIHGLLKLARSIRFEYFVFLFGGLTILAAVVQYSM